MSKKVDTKKAVGSIGAKAPKPAVNKPGVSKPAAKSGAEAKPKEPSPTKEVKLSQAEPPKKSVSEAPPKPIEINLKQINDVLDQTNDHFKKWPLIIDVDERVSAFLRHRITSYISPLDIQQLKPEKFRTSLIAAIRYGHPFVIDLMGSEGSLENVKSVFNEIRPNLYEDLIDMSLLKDEKFLELVRPEDGDDYKSYCFTAETYSKFICVFLTTNLEPSKDLLAITTPYLIV